MAAQHPILWTNDDILYGQSDKLQRMLDFLDPLNIPGIFFVIPRSGDKTLDQDVELCRLIESARNRGHEFYQHGYVHTPFESGVPETWMLDFVPAVRQQYDEQRLEIEQTHTLSAMIEMIEQGRRIWRRAMGDDSPGYRPGWGAFCGNLYHALNLLGFQWVSSRICALTGWLWNQGLWDQRPDFREQVPGSPWRVGKLIEYPIAGDYAFQVPDEPDKIDRMVQLFIDEFQTFRQRGWPLAVCSHWHGLERNGDTGYAVHAKALPRLLESGEAAFITMTELHRRTAASLPAAD